MSYDNLQGFFESTWGQVITIVIIILLFAVIFFVERKKGIGTKVLMLSAIFIALSLVLNQIKIFTMPQGGSITFFSMLPIVLAGYFLGTRNGMITGICVGLLSLIFNPYVIHPVQLLLDYPLAFGSLAIGAGFRRFKYGLFPCYLTGVLARYLVAVTSGVVFFGIYAPEGFSGLTWALWYNLTYLGVESLVTLPVIWIMYKSKFIQRVEKDLVPQLKN